MGLALEKIDINDQNINVLESFINSLNEEKETFRYFNKRTINAIDNHVYTCILVLNDEPIAYGHLDKEVENYWLGIVVKKEYQGKGVSKRMMTFLINRARGLNLKSIKLSVDISNLRALKLYQKYGFKTVSNNGEYYILEKEIIKIGISTLAFQGRSKENVEDIVKQNNWIVEFSSSFPYDKEMIPFFKEVDVVRFAHNYFPAPKTPFVMNLASENDIIRKQSINHCIQGLHLSKECGADYFSAHAGFCIDPDPAQLGKQLDVNVPIERSKNWMLFLESISEILIEAKKLNISFLIENNVTAKFNLRDDGQEVLFCSRPQEIIRLVSLVNSDKFGILLDTAHLKVSSNSLNFDLEEAASLVKPYVKYVHHSDNNGEVDTNEPIDNSYWFLPFMKHFSNCLHILEVKNIELTDIEDQINIISEHKK